MWLEACSLVVVFVSSNFIPEYVSKIIYASFFQWRVKGSGVEKTWRVLGPDCKLRLPFQIRLAYDMGWNDIMEAEYELYITTDNSIFVLFLLYWSIRFLRTFEWMKSVKPRCPWFFRQDGFFIFWKREPGHYFQQQCNKYDAVEEIHIWQLEQSDSIIPS